MLTSRSATWTLVLALVAAGVAIADDETPKKQLTLMGMLQEWFYPNSKFHGAQSSDAAVSDISAIKSKAILTTPDSVEEVLAFYYKKLNVDKEGKNLDEKPGERITTDRSVLIQNVSGDPPSNLYVIAVNSPKSSTTLVISRPEKSEVTRIAWSNYRQLWP
jgi:hypothetical protein